MAAGRRCSSRSSATTAVRAARAKRVCRIRREYRARGLAVVAINSNDLDAYPQDGPDAMRSEAAEFGYEFPYLVTRPGGGQGLSRRVHARFLPVRRAASPGLPGQFDDSRRATAVPSRCGLRAAVDRTLAGDAPSPDQLPSLGLQHQVRPGTSPTTAGPERPGGAPHCAAWRAELLRDVARHVHHLAHERLGRGRAGLDAHEAAPGEAARRRIVGEHDHGNVADRLFRRQFRGRGRRHAPGVRSSFGDGAPMRCWSDSTNFIVPEACS